MVIFMGAFLAFCTYTIGQTLVKYFFNNDSDSTRSPNKISLGLSVLILGILPAYRLNLKPTQFIWSIFALTVMCLVLQISNNHVKNYLKSRNIVKLIAYPFQLFFSFLLFIFILGSGNISFLPSSLRTFQGSDFLSYFTLSHILSQDSYSQLESRFSDVNQGLSSIEDSLNFHNFVERYFLFSKPTRMFVPYLAESLRGLFNVSLSEAYLVILAFALSVTSIVIWENLRVKRNLNFVVVLILMISGPTIVVSVLDGFYLFVMALPIASSVLVNFMRLEEKQFTEKRWAIVLALHLIALVFIYPEMIFVAYVLILCFVVIPSSISFVNRIRNAFLWLLLSLISLTIFTNGNPNTLLSRTSELGVNGFEQIAWYSPMDVIGINPRLNIREVLANNYLDILSPWLNFLVGLVIFTYILQVWIRKNSTQVSNSIFTCYIVLLVFNLVRVGQENVSNNYSHMRISSIFFPFFVIVFLDTLQEVLMKVFLSVTITCKRVITLLITQITILFLIAFSLLTFIVPSPLQASKYSFLAPLQSEDISSLKIKSAAIIASDIQAVASLMGVNDFHWINRNEETLQLYLSGSTKLGLRNTFIVISKKNINYSKCKKDLVISRDLPGEFALTKVDVHSKFPANVNELHEVIRLTLNGPQKDKDFDPLSCL